MAEIFRDRGYNTYAEVTGPLLPETQVPRGFSNVRHRPGAGAHFMEWLAPTIGQMRQYVEPWFMLLHVWEVHRPYKPPPDFKKQIGRKGYDRVATAVDLALEPLLNEVPPNTYVTITGDHGENHARTWIGDRFSSLARDVRRVMKPGRWFPRLDRNLADRAIGHGYSLFEPVVRVPLILAGPSVSPDVKISDQVRHIDLFPTLAELCGMQPPRGIDGRSLVPLLSGRSLPVAPAYMEVTGAGGEHPLEGVRIPDWKLVKGRGVPTKLFRLDANDRRSEKRNVRGKNAGMARQLASVIDEVALSHNGAEAGLTEDEENLVEQHLRDLGYL